MSTSDSSTISLNEFLNCFIHQKVYEPSIVSNWGLVNIDNPNITYSLFYGLNMIGRKSNNHIKTTSNSSSMVHAMIEIHKSPETIYVVDLSRNGTHIFREDNQVYKLNKDEIEAFHGDLIKIGKEKFILQKLNCIKIED